MDAIGAIGAVGAVGAVDAVGAIGAVGAVDAVDRPMTPMTPSPELRLDADARRNAIDATNREEQAARPPIRQALSLPARHGDGATHGRARATHGGAKATTTTPSTTTTPNRLLFRQTVVDSFDPFDQSRLRR